MNLIRGQDVLYHCIPYVNFDNIFLMIFIARWVYLSLSKFHLRSSILSYAKTLFHRHNKLKKGTQLRIKCNRKRKIQWNLDTTNLFVRVSLAPETPFQTPASQARGSVCNGTHSVVFCFKNSTTRDNLPSKTNSGSHIV